MSLKKTKQDLIENQHSTHIYIGEEFSDKEAQEIIREEIQEVVRDTIDEGEVAKATGRPFDADIGIMLELDRHEAWIDLRQRAYFRGYECDKAVGCTGQKSADVCYTKKYTSCPHYKHSSDVSPKHAVFSLGSTNSSQQ